MSRLFSGTPFEQPIKCDVCGKYIGVAEGCCRCIKSTLPPKKKMAAQPGGKHHGKPAASEFALTPENATPPKDQVARIRVEKRKGNREATVITGLEHPANDLARLLTDLKAALGCGGSVQGRTLELQGDQSAKAAQLLEGQGHKTRVL